LTLVPGTHGGDLAQSRLTVQLREIAQEIAGLNRAVAAEPR